MGILAILLYNVVLNLDPNLVDITSKICCFNMLRKTVHLCYEGDSSEDDSPGCSPGKNLLIRAITHDHSYCLLEVPLPETVPAAEPLPSSSSTTAASTPNSSSRYDEGLAYAQGYLSASVKDSTRSQYDRVYKIWQDFCTENNLPEFDAGHEALASCLSLVMHDTESFSKVSMLSSAIANEHRRHLKPSPTTHECITQLFRGFKLANQRSRQPVLPLTEEIIKQMINQLYQPAHGRDGIRAPLVLWRTVWRATIQFHTLGRFSDLVRLCRSDLRFECSPSLHLLISFKGGKNDLYSEGTTRIVAANPEESLYCPVNLTQNYLVHLGSSYNGYLVPSCLPNANPDPNKPISYGSALDDLRNLLNSLGYDGKLFGEHSGKRGGASAAAESGMDMDTLKRLGHWRSTTIPSKYVDLTSRSRIEMSRQLQKRF